MREPGHRIPPPPPSPLIAFGSVGGATPTADSTVPVDTPCKQCSYNLRGMTHGGRCPECGLPVEMSMLGHRLRCSHPAWIRKLLWGVNLTLLSLVLAPIAFIVLIVTGLSAPLWMGAGVLVVHWGMLVLVLVSAAGTWLLTEPDPSGLGERHNQQVRKLLRLLTVIGAGWSAAQAVIQTFDATLTGLAGVRFAETIADATSVAAMFLWFLYIRRLAELIPDQIIMQRARVLQWYSPILFGLLLIITSISDLAPGGLGGVACAVVLLIPILIGLGIMGILLTLRLRRLLARELTTAEQIWAAGLGGPKPPPAS